MVPPPLEWIDRAASPGRKTHRGTAVETLNTPIAAPIRLREAQMIAVTDRLLHEYNDAPTIVVLRAVLDARRELRQAGVVLAPAELVGARARGMLTPWAHSH